MGVAKAIEAFQMPAAPLKLTRASTLPTTFSSGSRIWTSQVARPGVQSVIGNRNAQIAARINRRDRLPRSSLRIVQQGSIKTTAAAINPATIIVFRIWTHLELQS